MLQRELAVRMFEIVLKWVFAATMAGVAFLYFHTSRNPHANRATEFVYRLSDRRTGGDIPISTRWKLVILGATFLSIAIFAIVHGLL